MHYLYPNSYCYIFYIFYRAGAMRNAPHLNSHWSSRLPIPKTMPQVALSIVAISAITLPLIGLHLFSQSARSTADQLALLEVETATYEQQSETVAALGRIEPADGVYRVGAPVNDIVAELRVEEGDWVSEGEVIAALRAYPERQAELRAAQQRLAAAQSQRQADSRYSQAQIDASQTDYQSIPAVQAEGLIAQEAVVSQLTRELAFEQAEYERFATLYEQGALAKNDLDQRQAKVIALEEQLRQAQATLQQQAAIRDRELASAKAQINTLTANAERTQSQSQVETAERELQLAQSRLESTLIRAPISGQVLRVLTQSGENVSDNGRGKGAVVDIADTQQMAVIAEVHETSIRQVQLGQQATIISRNGTFSEEITGSVVQVGNQIFKKDVLNEDPTAPIDTRVVEVKILLDEPDLVANLTNLQVDIEIKTETPSENLGESSL